MSKSGITNIKESIEKLINEQRANKPKDIGVPKDKDLPFFAYGFLKSDELAYHKIKDLVRNNHPNKIVEGFLYEKDGIPIFTQERKVKRIPYDSIQGELIYFTDGNEAYKKIAEIEPGDLYCWGTIKIDSNRIANVLIASEELLSEKKTINGAVKLEKADNLYVDWHGYRDVLFTKGMQFLQDEFFNNLDYDKPHGKRFRSDKEYQDFFKLQMAYAFLWTIIDRHNALKYSLNSNALSSQRSAMAVDPLFEHAINAIGSDFNFNYPGIYASSSGKSKSFKGKENNPYDDWRAKIELYYQVRCNVVHRGKGTYDATDYPKLRGAFLDMFAIMQYMLKKELRTDFEKRREYTESDALECIRELKNHKRRFEESGNNGTVCGY